MIEFIKKLTKKELMWTSALFSACMCLDFAASGSDFFLKADTNMIFPLILSAVMLIISISFGFAAATTNGEK